MLANSDYVPLSGRAGMLRLEWVAGEGLGQAGCRTAGVWRAWGGWIKGGRVGVGSKQHLTCTHPVRPWCPSAPPS